jgi:lipopolysaccharide heptosyltransferase I
VLFVKLGAIGDIVHTLPALAAVRRERPDIHLTWVAERRSAEILRGNPLIESLVEIDTRAMREGGLLDEMVPEIRRQLGPLRKQEFDIAIDFQGLIKSGIVAKLSGAKARWGFSRKNLREPASRLFLNKTVKIPKATNVIEKNLRLAGAALGPFTNVSEPEFPIFTDAEHRLEADTIGARAGGNFAILNPGGGWVTKLWHTEKFGQLADRIWEEHGIVPIIATGPAEKEIAERVLAASRSGKTIAAEPSLKGFYELAKRARVYIGGDTGPTHLAVAARTPVVGIFGPTEWWRNGSPYRDDSCVERNDIGCRIDCHRRTCSNWICMDISVETVSEAVSTRLVAAAVPELATSQEWHLKV